MKYKIWNKIDPIKGQNFDYWQESLKIEENDGVFLVIDDYENIIAVEIDRIIKSVYELAPELTTEEVAQEYIRIKMMEKEEAKTLNLNSKNTEERIVEIVKECMISIFKSANLELPQVLK